MQRQLGQLLAFSGLLFIAATTLVPLPRQAAAVEATPLWCLICGAHGGVDVVNNVLLFIPVALGLRLMGMRGTAVIAAGAAISLTIESLQFAVIEGRDASLSDLLTNILGAWIGAALGGKQASLLKPTKRGAIRLAVAGGMIWLGVQAGTAVLLRPWVPSEPLRVEWRRSAAGHAGFAGRVTSAFVSGSAVPDGSTPLDSELATRLGEGRVHLELGLTSGGITSGWSTVFQLVGSHGPLLAVEAVGTDLAFQPPARAYRLRLRSPTLRLPAALPSRPGTPLQFAAGEQHDTLWATSRTAGVRRQARQTLSPSLGWSLLIPFSYAYGPEVHLLTGLWLAGLLAPIAYWSAHTRGNGYRLTLALALLLLAGLGLIPLVAGYPAVHWSEWLAGGAGLAVGWGAHGAAAYLGDRCDSPSTRESC